QRLPGVGPENLGHVGEYRVAGEDDETGVPGSQEEGGDGAEQQHVEAALPHPPRPAAGKGRQQSRDAEKVETEVFDVGGRGGEAGDRNEPASVCVFPPAIGGEETAGDEEGEPRL